MILEIEFPKNGSWTHLTTAVSAHDFLHTLLVQYIESGFHFLS